MATVVQPPPSSSLMWISRVWLSCSTLTRWCGLPCSCRPRIVRPGDGVGATNDVHRPLGGSGRCTVPLLPGCRVCRRPHLRRGGAPGPRAPAHLGRARRREQPPDRSDRCRGSRAQGVGARRHRPHPRAGVPVEGGLVLPRRRRPRRRGMGAPPRLGLSSTGSPPGWPARSGVPPRWPSSTAPNGPAPMPAPPT